MDFVRSTSIEMNLWPVEHFCPLFFSRSWSVVHFYRSNFLQNPYFRIYQLTHISANFISTVVVRAISNFSKIHTFLICRMQKMGEKNLVHHWTWLIIESGIFWANFVKYPLLDLVIIMRDWLSLLHCQYPK